MRMVDGALPSLIGEDNSELVAQLLGAQMGTPISESFDPEEALATIFGRVPKIPANCRLVVTKTGDPSPEPCVVKKGKAEGRGAYTEFSWSRNLGFGDLRYLRRVADRQLQPGDLKPVQMTDEEAYRMALDFLVETMGLPPEEIPMPPQDAQIPLPVRTLAIGGADPQGQRTLLPAMKMVQVPRGLLADLRDPVTGQALPYVPAPGEAYVLMNDEGIWQASVRQWRELERSPMVDPANAKSRSELIAEITDAILENETTPIHSLGVKIGIQAGDPLLLPAVQKVRSAMLPAVQISISVAPRDASEEEQGRLGPSTAGQTHEFLLVHMQEGGLRDEGQGD
jgi:hypothetical protein